MGPLAVSPEEFRRRADRVADAATALLASLDDRRLSPAASAPEMEAAFDRPAPEEGIGESVFDDLAGIADNVRIGNGRLFPYVVSPGEPVGALGDLYASVLNQNVTAWRSAPAAVAIERTVVRWLAEAVGSKEGLAFSDQLLGNLLHRAGDLYGAGDLLVRARDLFRSFRPPLDAGGLPAQG